MTLPLRPFARTPGRDIGKDRPAPFDIAQFYFDQRFRIAEDAPVLRKLIEAVNWPNDLAAPQWAQWYSVALGFEPDLIVELGRGYGNSTALFAQAASRLGQTKVVSLCLSAEWTSLVAAKVARVVDREWFARVDARRADILAADYAAILADHQRVLLLWDAHGFEIAELVLGEILPRLADRHHLVLMHDISDNRYADVSRSYQGQPLWKGSKWQQGAGAWNSRVNIGWMNSIQDQVIALADFSARNDLEIESADHEYTRYFAADPAKAAEMQEVLGDEFFSMIGDWAFLSLSGRSGPFHFPAVSARRRFSNQCDLVLEPARLLPTTIVTAAKPWVYAATFAWRPVAPLPPDAERWIRCRVRVEGGMIGISLLSPDETRFVESKPVSSSSDAVDVLLPVADVSRHGRLVIHTWDAAESARVRIDELALVW
jgi:SAM-dependent methyltransferase